MESDANCRPHLLATTYSDYQAASQLGPCLAFMTFAAFPKPGRGSRAHACYDYEGDAAIAYAFPHLLLFSFAASLKAVVRPTLIQLHCSACLDPLWYCYTARQAPRQLLPSRQSRWGLVHSASQVSGLIFWMWHLPTPEYCSVSRTL